MHTISIRTPEIEKKTQTNDDKIPSPKEKEHVSMDERIIYTRKMQRRQLSRNRPNHKLSKRNRENRCWRCKRIARAKARKPNESSQAKTNMFSQKALIHAVIVCTCANTWLAHEGCTWQSVKEKVLCMSNQFSTKPKHVCNAIAQFYKITQHVMHRNNM